MPERAVAESLVEALRDVPVSRALIARAEEGRDVLPDALRERGAEVVVVPLYRTVAEELDAETREAVLDADYVTFTSASSVRVVPRRDGQARIAARGCVSIGPATSAALREHGVEPDDRGAGPHARRPGRRAARRRGRALTTSRASPRRRARRC